MASGMTVEVDHKRGSVWIRGRPEAVEEGRRDFHNKLASLFPGDFLAVSAEQGREQGRGILALGPATEISF